MPETVTANNGVGEGRLPPWLEGVVLMAEGAVVAGGWVGEGGSVAVAAGYPVENPGEFEHDVAWLKNIGLVEQLDVSSPERILGANRHLCG